MGGVESAGSECDKNITNGTNEACTQQGRSPASVSPSVRDSQRD
eukprot:CAMPEP_0168471248 /NCGR_PEP_ID=MMETSP0228-20121227/59184_1 /TAXON_ID=133427 /ORGANISM="Protoceratium reticulatum, Strain CCCM 535 (=CCMP 1889)" /LENGTH=43 /DNA_ID= /DNA_START= /DNA_END= /DNA_ORIENTATION=